MHGMSNRHCMQAQIDWRNLLFDLEAGLQLKQLFRQATNVCTDATNAQQTAPTRTPVALMNWSSVLQVATGNRHASNSLNW